MTGQTVFILVWIGIAVVMLTGIALVFVWAVRNRQFSDQDRARRLPLDSGIPEEDEPNTEHRTQNDENNDQRKPKEC